MPKVNQQSDTNRRQTRAKNANAHPGRVVMEVLGGRRKQEDIERDKEGKKERRDARERKKMEKLGAIEAIAEYENEMAVDDKVQGTRFPRHQSEVNVPKRPKDEKKRKVASTGGNIVSDSYTNKKVSLAQAAHQRLEERVEPDNDTQAMAKKQKIKALPLCRTETYIRPEGGLPVDIPMPDARTMEIYTPKPRQSKKVITQSKSESEDSPNESEDDFETPRALKMKAPTHAEFNSNFGETADINLPKTGVECSENGSELNFSNNESGVAEESDESDIYERRSATPATGRRNVQDFKTIDLTKIQMKATGKDKRAFRKEIDERRTVIMNLKNKNENLKVRALPAHAAGRNASYHDRDSQAKSNIVSRNSTTSGLGIQFAGYTGKETRLTSESKPKSIVVTGGLSDEDDTAERESILQSPPKGITQLSSTAIVKVETNSDEGRKTTSRNRTRSRKDIIDPEVLDGWKRFVEPNFIYFSFFELRPWPTSEDVEDCVQKLWGWRFGDSHPLDLVKTPAYVQLKLCDVRSQTASSAIANLDMEFQLQVTAQHGDAKSGLDLEEITHLRQRYATDLSSDKKFLFGKYVAAGDGSVRKSRPYQNTLVLRTLASAFKHLKEVNLDPECDEKDGPLPSSRYPKTLLAIVAAAVERALALTIDNDYDFVTNKVIPKPDPNHPTHKPTVNMFAFSEGTWEPRVDFYLTKSIVRLTVKEWESIMEAAAEYSTVIRAELKRRGKKKVSSQVHKAEEEMELEYANSSDLETGRMV